MTSLPIQKAAPSFHTFPRFPGKAEQKQDAPASTRENLRVVPEKRPSFWAKAGKLLLIPALFLSSASMVRGQSPLKEPERIAAIQAESLKAEGRRILGDAEIDEAVHPFVNAAKDLPLLNRKMTDLFVDLVHNPLVAPAQREEIITLLQSFNSTPDGKMAVVVIPSTQLNELNTLATEIFNQMGVGEEGKNDGLLLLLNADAIRNGNQVGRMIQLMVGNGLESKITEKKVLEILEENALPHLRAQNPEAAIKGTVIALETMLKTHGASEAVDTVQTVAITVVTTMVALFLAALAFDMSIGYRHGFPATRLYLEILRIVLMVAASGKGGGGGGSRGGGVSGGRGGGF
jgi:uncharacterized protein